MGRCDTGPPAGIHFQLNSGPLLAHAVHCLLSCRGGALSLSLGSELQLHQQQCTFCPGKSAAEGSMSKSQPFPGTDYRKQTIFSGQCVSLGLSPSCLPRQPSTGNQSRLHPVRRSPSGRRQACGFPRPASLGNSGLDASRSPWLWEDTSAASDTNATIKGPFLLIYNN